jgi:NDP-sugar pyrophosphorylase family protein
VIGPNVYIESGAHIGNGVHLHESIVLQGAHIADHQQHSNAVIL